MPSIAPNQRFDVVICGGGLAGLTLGLHLRKRVPDASVAVVEPTERPLPDACHKVGESSVEIGAHFFEDILGLRGYLRERQLVKNGLRYFVGEPREALAMRREIGPSEQPVVPSYQIDRGRFESDLRQLAVDAGVTLFEGFSASNLELASAASADDHALTIAAKGERATLRARWILDASGRRRLIQKKLGLGRDAGHDHNSVWFRLDERIDVASLVPESERAWHSRDVDHNRWLSTVHLCGRGYWVWLIPLSSGYHSVGIVASEAHHPYESMARPERALEWLSVHEPALYRRIAECPMRDFSGIKRYAYLSEQVFSSERWACVGEAGVFIDPLYSPGSDFIALSNVMAAELVRADLAQQPIASMVDEFNHHFLAFAEVTATTFRGHGHINGAPGVMAAKLYWDNFHYWSFICPYFFNGIYRLDVDAHRPFRSLHREFASLNQKAQSILKRWGEVAPGETKADFVPLPQFPSALAELHIDLATRYLPEQVFAKMQENLRGAHEVVLELALRAIQAMGPHYANEIMQITGLDPHAIDPRRLDRDSQDRATRRREASRIVRDMERCLGRPEGDAPLRQVIDQGSSPAESPIL